MHTKLNKDIILQLLNRDELVLQNLKVHLSILREFIDEWLTKSFQHKG